MTPEEMKTRTKAFALRVIKLVLALPKNSAGYVIGRQLLRSGTSVGANYRAACCARSTADFVAKMGIVEEKIDESAYWMELLVDAAVVKKQRMTELMLEARELLAITVASINTARRGKRDGRSSRTISRGMDASED